jgi:iron complex outermembrane recepter protein
MFRKTKLCSGLMLAFGGSAMLAADLAMAQQAAPQRIEITGSNIRRVDSETSQPVVTIRREDIERSGKTSLSELLQSLSVVSGGSFSENTNAGNSFAPGTASISLRGLGVNTTLTLLNGRRIANYGFAQNLNENFVDLNAIPVSAIERIEILKDGASAIYGSDAIAGVVNVILRKDFKGAELGASYGVTTKSDGDEMRSTLTFGFGDLGTDRFNVMATIDLYKRQLTEATNRTFSTNADNRGQGPGGRDVRSPTGNPGYFFGGTGNVNTPFANCPADRIVPAASLGVGGGGNVCAFDFAPNNKLTPDAERSGILASATYQLTNDMQLFSELMLNRNTTGRYGAPTPAAFTLAAAHPDRPAGSTFTSVAYRFVEAGDRLNTLTTDSTRLLLGTRGTFGKVEYEVGLLGSKSETEDLAKNYIVQERATQAFAGTLPGFTGQFYRVVNPALNSQALIDAIKIDPRRTGTSKLGALDARFSAELFSLEGGPAAVAAGFERRGELVADNADPRVALTTPPSVRVTVAGSGGTSVVGKRWLSSGFVELSLPFFKGLETQLALRTDRYSDFGTATTPKLGFSFRPNPSVLVRGGAAKGFRAPSLAEIYLGESTSFPVVQDAPRCAAYRAGPLGPNDARTLAACGGAAGSGASAQVRSIFLGNRDLEPETSKSYSLGLVVEPVKDFTVGADIYYIDHDNRILAPTAAFILANESLFPGAVARNAPSPDDVAANAPGGLRGTSGDLTPGVVRTFFNASKQRTHGIDVDLRYRWNTAVAGRVDLSTNWTYTGSLKRQINPGQPLVEIADTFQFPRWRNVTTGTWSVGSWASTLTFNTIGSYLDNFRVNGQFPRLKRWTALDLNVTYSGFKDVRLSVGGNNIADREPPFSNLDWYGYDSGTHNPRGAFWYARANYKF